MLDLISLGCLAGNWLVMSFRRIKTRYQFQVPLLPPRLPLALRRYSRRLDPSLLVRPILLSTAPARSHNAIPVSKRESDVDNRGMFDDEYELLGPERDAALASPLKGKKRLTSTVITQFTLFLFGF